MKHYHCLFGGKQREGKTTGESDPCRKKLKPSKREDQCPFYSAFNNIRFFKKVKNKYGVLDNIGMIFVNALYFRVQEDFDTDTFKFFLKHKHVCKCDRNKRVLRRKLRSDILLEIKNMVKKGNTAGQIYPIMANKYPGSWKPTKAAITWQVNNFAKGKQANLRTEVVKIIKDFDNDTKKIKQWIDRNRERLTQQYDCTFEVFTDKTDSRLYIRIG